MKEVGVFGIFRSGTNFVRTILEWNYDCRAAYDYYGWKHGFFPVIVAESKLHYQRADFIHVSKNPFSAIESLHRYFSTRGKNVKAHREWKDFLRGRLVIFDSHQPSSPEYRFANPVEYWNAMNWNLASVALPDSRCLHVQYERALRAPEAEAARLAAALHLSPLRSADTAFRVPTTRLRNMGDGPRQNEFDYVTQEPFDRAHQMAATHACLKRFDTEDLQFVLANLDLDLAHRLGYADEISLARNRLIEKVAG